MRIVQIENEDDYQWLKKYLITWDIRCKDDIPTYVEYADRFERLRAAFEEAPRTASPVEVEEAAPVKKPRAKRGEKAQFDPKFCPEHPKYGAKRTPRTDCEHCWAAYKKYNGNKIKASVLQRRKS